MDLQLTRDKMQRIQFVLENPALCETLNRTKFAELFHLREDSLPSAVIKELIGIVNCTFRDVMVLYALEH